MQNKTTTSLVFLLLASASLSAMENKEKNYNSLVKYVTSNFKEITRTRDNHNYSRVDFYLEKNKKPVEYWTTYKERTPYDYNEIKKNDLWQTICFSSNDIEAKDRIKLAHNIESICFSHGISFTLLPKSKEKLKDIDMWKQLEQ